MIVAEAVGKIGKRTLYMNGEGRFWIRLRNSRSDVQYEVTPERAVEWRLLLQKWPMLCIGTGPGPKNVLSVDDSGRRVVFSYRAWKALPKGAPVAEGTEGTWVVMGGVVQQFKKDGNFTPVVRSNNVNGQNVDNFTIKTFPGQKLVSVSLWPEFAGLAAHLKKGAFVALEGKLREETKNGTTYYNVSASEISVLVPVARQERPVENAVQPQAAPAADAAPAAQPAASGTIF